MGSAATITISVDISEVEALALAQLLKRMGWQEWRGNAVDDDEAYLMRSACGRLQEGLAQVGFSPR